MSSFAATNYRRALAQLLKERRSREPGWTSAKLAEKCRIQRSYLSNVVQERAHLSADQLYALSEGLGLPADERDYLVLLMEWERAEHGARRKHLEGSLEEIRQRNLSAKRTLSAPAPTLSPTQSERYYLDPNIELFHLYLGTRGAPTAVTELARIWGLSAAYVAEILGFLRDAGLVKAQKNGWKVERIHQLLPRESPLCKPQQMLKRVRALEALQRLPPEKIYSFSGTLTMTEETRTQVQARFLAFLKDCERLVLASDREGLYHLQFDLFPWVSAARQRAQ